MIQSTDVQNFSVGGISLKGVSTAGIGTSIVIPHLKVCFDTAQGLPHAFHAKHYMITHAHMDHAGGIPYILSQKSMTSQESGVFYMPKNMVQPMTDIMEIWSKMEHYKCPFRFVATEVDTDYTIDKNHFFRVFPTYHRVPSNGYTVFEKKRKLNPKYLGLSKDDIIRAKTQHDDFWIFSETPIISFTGDTKIEFLDGPEWVGRSRVLLMEVTYGGHTKTPENAREWGHIHLDELIQRLPNLSAENIVLIHRSARHSLKEFSEIIKQEVPREYLGRIHLFP